MDDSMSFIARKKGSIQYTFMRVLIPALAITLVVVAVLIGLYVNQSTQKKLSKSQESFLTLLAQILPQDMKDYNAASAEKLLKVAAIDKNILFMELSDGAGNVIAKVGDPDRQSGEVLSREIRAANNGQGKPSGVVRYQFAAQNYKETVIVEIIKVMLLLVISLIVISVVMYLV